MSGAYNVTYDVGTLEIVTVPVGSFVSSDPSTWGFTSTPSTLYTLADPQTVLSGASPVLSSYGAISTNPSAWPQQVTFPESQMNTGNLNTVIGNSSQGLILFDKSATQEVPPVLGTDSGQLLPPDYTGVGYTEGLLVKSEQTIIDTTGTTLSAADETALNNIGTWAFGGVFATFGTGTATDYTPTVAGGNAVPNPGNGSLDFAAQLGVSAYPTLAAVPEPISAAIWGVMGLAGLAWGSYRKHR